MMKSKSAEKIKLTSYDDLFGSSEVTAEEKIVSVRFVFFTPSKTIHSGYWMMKKCRRLWKV